MNDDIDRLIKPFEQAAEDAHRAEAGYARQFEVELARRKRDREFAFRRLGLVRELLKAACKTDAEAAAAAQVDCLRSEIGWHDLSPAREKIIAEFTKLAAVIHNLATARQVKGKKPQPAITTAFAGFESWYAAETGSAFLALLDHEIPEMPLVDF